MAQKRNRKITRKHMQKIDQKQRDAAFNFLLELGNYVKGLFERRQIDGLFPVFFIFYSYRHDLPLSFSKDSMEFERGKDTLQDKLYDAALLAFGGDSKQFARLMNVQIWIASKDRTFFQKVYPLLIDSLLCQTDLVAGTQMQPNSRIAFTVASILKEHGCETVFGAYSGIGIYALACAGMKYIGAEPYAPANLIAEVLCDAFGVEKPELYHENPLDQWPNCEYDAVIGNLPTDADFFNEYKADHCLHEYNERQNEFIQKLLKEKTARKTAALLIHFEFANYPNYDDTRKYICERGMLEAVIALPENIFRDARVPTYLLILDMKGGRSEVEFLDATQSKIREPGYQHAYRDNLYDMRQAVQEEEWVRVSYDQIAEASWSFNPAVYIQNAIASEGQELIRLGDLVRIPNGKKSIDLPLIEYGALSDNFSQIVAGITPTTSDFDFFLECLLVEGPAVLVAMSAGTRREGKKLVYGICRENGSYEVVHCTSILQPDPEKISPEYLVLALMSDPSFAVYYQSIQEYYVDIVRDSHLLERRIPIFVDMATQRKAVMEALGREDMAKIRYNLVIAGSGRQLDQYRNGFARYRCDVLANVETVEGPNGLLRIVEEVTGSRVPVSRRADAVVFISDIRLNEKDSEPFSGLDAILDLRLVHPELKLFVSSRHSLDTIREAGIISSRRLSPLADGHFFMTDKNGDPDASLFVSVRNELDRDLSPGARIRSRHQAVFEAAEWLDEAYPEKDIHAAAVISEFLMAAEEGVDSGSNLSTLRNVAHRIIEILKDCGAVPPIDNGAIPHLLYDGRYLNNKDHRWYFQNVSIMKKSLSSALISLIDIGNEGTHSFRTSANLGSAMLQTLLEFVTWIYEKHEEFSTKLTTYWQVESEEEVNWEETSGPAELKYTEGGISRWVCGDTCLYVPAPGFDIHEGDPVIVRARKTYRGKPIPGVAYMAYPRDKKNPNGYIIDTDR